MAVPPVFTTCVVTQTVKDRAVYALGKVPLQAGETIRNILKHPALGKKLRETSCVGKIPLNNLSLVKSDTVYEITQLCIYLFIYIYIL